jgi:hypothetical protein
MQSATKTLKHHGLALGAPAIEQEKRSRAGHYDT